MDGSSSSGCGSVNKCIANYKLVRTLCSWKFGKVIFAEHVLSGDKVSIYIINRRWTFDKQMEEMGTYHLHINNFKVFYFFDNRTILKFDN
jgi:hypothetical protein